MQLGMVGLGRMGANMVRRLMLHGHQCVVFDRNATAVQDLAKEGAAGGASLDDFVMKLARPRAIWLMVPAAVVDQTIQELAPRSKQATSSSMAAILTTSMTSVGPRNSRQRDPLCRCRHQRRRLGPRTRLLHDDRRRRCGGADLDPIFKRSRPESATRRALRAGRRSAAPRSKAICTAGRRGGPFRQDGPNGIEYGMMAAYAEGLNILKHANIGKAARHDAETTPLRNPEHYQYDLDLATSPKYGGAAAWSRPGCWI